MSNMTKAFEKKSALRRIHMADGGLVDKAKTDLGNRGAVIDAAVDGKPAPTPAPKPAPAPAPKAAPVSEDAARAAVGMAPKKGMLRSLLGLAEGGHVQGPGGPREDKVPAMLSNGEYVLPAKTVQKLGGPEGLDELVEQTNDGREPARHRSGLRHLAGGGVIEIGADGLPRTNGVSIPAGNQLATIPGEVAQKLPGTQMATVPGQTARTIPPVQPMDTSDLKARAASIRQQFPSGAGMQSSVGASPTPPVQASPGAATRAPGMLRSLAGGAGNLAKGLIGGAGNLAKGLIGGAGGAIGAMTGAVQSYNDMDNGYRDQFNKSVGADTPLQTFGADALRTMGNVGNAVTFGLAGKLGQGISSATNGGSFSDGFSAPTGRDAFLAAKEPKPVIPQAPGQDFGPPTSLSNNPPQGRPTDAAPSPRSLAQSRYLSEQGVDVATQASAPVKPEIVSARPILTDKNGWAMNESVTPQTGLRNVTEPGKFVNLGSFQGQDNIYGTSTTKGGRVNSFVGAGDPNREESQQTKDAVAKLQSDLAADKLATAQKTEAENLARASQGNAGAINARFDAMAGKVAGSYSKAGKGNENKRLLEIEAQRNNALEADARNTTSVRGQTLQAQNNSAENVLKGKQIDEQARAHAATLRGQLAPKPINPLDAAKFVADRTDQARKDEAAGADAINKSIADSIARRFPGADKDPAMGAKAEDFNKFLQTLPPPLLGRIRSDKPTERDAAIEEGKALYDQRNVINERTSTTTRGITSSGNVLPKGASRPAEFGDYWGPGSLPFSNLPRIATGALGWNSGQVQPLDNGGVVPLNDLTNDDSGLIGSTKNVSKIASLQQQREYQRQAEEKARIEKLKQEAKK